MKTNLYVLGYFTIIYDQTFVTEILVSTYEKILVKVCAIRENFPENFPNTKPKCHEGNRKNQILWEESEKSHEGGDV